MTTHEQEAYDLGVAHAKNAASWVIDGNVSENHYRSVLAMLDEGDPEAYDYLPAHPNLSGEYADSMTPARLLEELGLDWEDTSDDVLEAVCDAYEQGVTETFETEFERLLRSAVE